MIPAPVLGAAKASAVGLALSLVIFAYERALVPLYGSTPTNYLLHKIVLCSILLATTSPIRLSARKSILLSGLWTSIAPLGTYWLAVWTSRRWKEPVWGPAVPHLIILAPITYIATNLVRETEISKHAVVPANSRPPVLNRMMAITICCSAASGLVRGYWSEMMFLDSISESQIFLSISGILLASWIIQYPFSTSEKKTRKGASKTTVTNTQLKYTVLSTFVGLWYINSTKLLSSPVLPHPLQQKYTHPSYPLEILSSVQSKTGLIVVGEALPPTERLPGADPDMHSLRYLRASHSILGGVWMHGNVATLEGHSPMTDSYGTPLGDSIYSTFVLQETIRMVNSTEKGKTDTWNDALIIGLGAGISATAFMRHDISTTIVEIDPAVYDAARRFFGLPDPGLDKVFLQDARGWVAQKRASLEKQTRETGNSNLDSLYDIVVHDCFSGGGVPEHIFTREFWEDVKTLMHPEGVIAINFAGKVRSLASRAIIHTLEDSFGQCRAFHDSFNDLTEEQYDTDFINMVFFCSPSTHPLTFRTSRASDYLGSHLRRHVFTMLPAREVPLAVMRGNSTLDSAELILTDDHNPLGEWQESDAFHHWTLMREVLPDVFWETY